MMLALVLFVFVAVLLLAVDLMSRKSKFGRAIDKIPGPRAYPVVGNLLTIAFANEERMFELFSEYNTRYSPIFRSWLGHLSFVHMTCPNDIEKVLSSTKHSSKSEIYKALHMWLGTGLLTSSGGKWQQRRKILTPTFHFNILQEFFNIFKEQTVILVQQFEKECYKPCTNIIPHITNFTLNSICETAMGTVLNPNDKKQDEYRTAVYDMGKVAVYKTLKPWFYYDFLYKLSPKYWEQKRLAKILHDFSRNVINKRKESLKLKCPNPEKEGYVFRKRLAMLDLLLTARAEDGAAIDDEGIREEVDTFMFEGHDTTAICICFTLMLLACNQDAQEKVLQELDEVFGDSDRLPTYTDIQDLYYLELCIKESLRLYPSVPIISRIASEDIDTYSGYRVPAGASIIVHIYDLHHNPEIYPEPYKFIPERFLPDNTRDRHPYAYLPFSAGPRNCIGQKFAMLELKTVLSGILRKFRLEPVDRPCDINLKTDMVLRWNEDIRIKFRLRKNESDGNKSS